MGDQLRFLFNRTKEHLWIRPLLMCIFSILAVFFAKIVDLWAPESFVPSITTESVEVLLTILSSSMLVIATFSVASMVSAYASASNTATPRTFSLVISDDVTQNALSTFIGAFIYSIVALVAFMNGFYEEAGRFALFLMTLSILLLVITTFLRWVDKIARLGRLGGTIDKVEMATAAALRKRRVAPTLRCLELEEPNAQGRAMLNKKIGYIQRIKVEVLQDLAKKADIQFHVVVSQGDFVVPGQTLAFLGEENDVALDETAVSNAFVIADDRVFDEDPRFGFTVLSEIAGRALSPAVNDPGTAIEVLNTLIRLLALWGDEIEEDRLKPCVCDRVAVAKLSTRALFDDAFTSLGRDGAALIEVAARLQETLSDLAFLGDKEMQEAARFHSKMALARSEQAMSLVEDVEVLNSLALFKEDA